MDYLGILLAPREDGEPVFCDGRRVGTFRGDHARPGGWYVETVPTREMPADLADLARRNLTTRR